MAKNKFDFKLIEEKYKKLWADEGIYKADLSKTAYSIDTPPPTVSGKMHIGHAFSYAQQDFIARFFRMKCGNVFYPFGTDDNGLPTERLVERINKVKSVKMSRADFIALCLKTLKKEAPSFIQDWKDLGVSCDYDISYSTIDPQAQKVSQESFVDLFNKKYIYKKSFPTLWCPECQTSIAQAELEDKESKTFFSTLKFEVNGEDLFIATTRPELLGACVAVFVNPKDKRYKKLVGKKAKVPLFNFEVPILEDESAEIDKGTGVLMICSYGDKFDVESINRHKLSPKLIMGKDGCIDVKGYEGFYVTKARSKILEDLKTAGLIEEQKEMTHVVNVHDKCGTAIEFVDTPQWFISIMDKKKELLKQGNKIKWYPEYMKKRYVNWVNGLEWDWSISRNRHFGIPIPAWECKCSELVVAEKSELPVDPETITKKCSKCNGVMKAETMVLDTWATSSLTPQIAADLVGNKIKIPYSLRPNGHDIIRTWAFYTIVKSYLHEGEIPWKDIVVSGMVSIKGEKMSKSKGNGVEPREVFKEYGSDALRFWAAGSKLGSDLDYQEKDLVAGKKIVNKILNASKFVFMNLEDYDGKSKPKKLEILDEIFLQRVNELVKNCTGDFEKYEYSRAKLRAEQFFYSDFCDNYLEIVKKRVYQGEGEPKLSAQYTLYKSLLVIVKLLAPIMPFITEEIYQENYKKLEKDKSIHSCTWPEFKNEKSNDEIFDLFLDVLSKIRQEKTKAQKAMNSEIVLTISKEENKKLSGVIEDLKSVTNAKEINEGKFNVSFI